MPLCFGHSPGIPGPTLLHLHPHPPPPADAVQRQQEKDAVQHELDATKKQRDDLQNEVNSLKSSKDELQKELDAAKQQKQEVENRASSSDTTLSSMKQKVRRRRGMADAGVHVGATLELLGARSGTRAGAGGCAGCRHGVHCVSAAGPTQPLSRCWPHPPVRAPYPSRS